MPRHFLAAAFLFDALDDLERLVAGLTEKEAHTQPSGLSSISWTVAHLAQHLDSWVVITISKQPGSSYFKTPDFSRGGTGKPAVWGDVRQAFSETLRTVRSFLVTTSEEELMQKSVYSGSIDSLKGKTVTPSYRLARIAAHIYYHIGEINTLRASFGTNVGDYPGLLLRTLDATNKSAQS